MKILTVLLIVLIVGGVFQRDWKALGRKVFHYLIACAIVVGLPMGVAELWIPEAEGHEQMMMKEVQEWISFSVHSLE